MKYTLKMQRPSDPLFCPWDVVVEDNKYPDVLTIQQPHPLAGANLIGFEKEFESMDITVHEGGWQEVAIGKHMVIAEKGHMTSVRDLVVDEVVDNNASV